MTTIEIHSVHARDLRHEGYRPGYIVIDDIDPELVLNPICIEDLNFENEFNRGYDIGLKLHNEIRKNVNDLLEKTVRENSCPPIKGEITKGKLKWRSIKLCQRSTGNRLEQWIEQRGVKLGIPVIIEFPLLYESINKNENEQWEQ